jgi:(S)-mandelate dehydrogenase
MTLSSDNSAPPAATYWRRRQAEKTRNIAGLRDLARKRLPRGIFDFIDGGAEDEATLEDNSAAFRRHRLLPRVLIDVSKTDLRSRMLGTETALPLAIGPTGGAGFVWPRGDIALALVAQRNNLPFTLSTTSSVSIEHLRERTSGRLWFQSYIFKQRDFTDRLISRAKDAEYEALVITVDLPVGGNRERDYRNDFSVPFRYTPRNVLDCALKPEWLSTILRYGFPSFGNLTDFNPTANSLDTASTVGRNYDPSFAWQDLDRIRQIWPRKLIVKGVVHPADAERIVRMGADAIVVSNHGGRQLDTGPATLDALPAVKDAVGDKIEVFLDGGIRRGSDVVKALALGADAVLLGRATLYGLAGAGEHGVDRAMTILKQELTRTMQLCGVNRIDEIGRDFIM